MVPPTPDGQFAQPIDWGLSQAKTESPALPELNVGAYITNINNIDLLDEQFTIEMLLWTEWSVDPAANPSAAEVLSAVEPDHWIEPWHKLCRAI